jgi:hypothetical protein
MPSSLGLTNALQIVGTAPMTSTSAIKITAVRSPPASAQPTRATSAPSRQSRSTHVYERSPRQNA